MAFVQPLDLQTIFVNYFSGSWLIFYLLLIAVFAYVAAKFRFTNEIFLLMLVVLVTLLAPFYPLLYGLVILLMGIFAFSVIIRIFNR